MAAAASGLQCRLESRMKPQINADKHGQSWTGLASFYIDRLSAKYTTAGLFLELTAASKPTC
jgi:hypothetical protein